jgi:hypothetical protein
MRAWLAEGRVSTDTLVWREGWRDWQEAGNVFPHLAPGEAIPGLEAIVSESLAAPIQTRPVKHHARARNVPAIVLGVLVLVLILIGVLVWILQKNS